DSVIVNHASSNQGSDQVMKEIKSQGGQAVAVQANLAKPDEVERLFTEAKKSFDKLDILVNNAGIYDFAPLENLTPEHFHKQFDRNVLGLLLASRHAA